MAQLKDTVISGSLRVTDTIFSTNLNLTSLTASYAVLTDADKNLVSRAIYNRTSVGDLEWTAAATDVHLVTKNTLAYWNGRYNSSTSNLAYCNKGAFGNAVTYGVDDATANGALGTGTNLTTERSVYYGLVIVNNASQTRATSIYAPTSAGTANQILVSKGGTSAPEWKATANGAAYATSSNGALTFGTLPTAQGGTGNTSYTAGRFLYTTTASKFATSDAAQFNGTDVTLSGIVSLTNTTASSITTPGALNISGGATIANNLYIGGWLVVKLASDLTASNNGVTANTTNGYYISDSSDRGIAYLLGRADTNGDTYGFLKVRSFNTAGTDIGYKGITIHRTKANNTKITLEGNETLVEHKLNIGVRETTTAPSSTTAYDRITITPFYHTGGPWQIRLRENGTEAFLSLYYGETHLTSIRHDGARPYAYEGFCRGVYNGSVAGSTHAEALQATFNSYKSIIPRNQLLAYYSSAHSNGSLCFGYWLSNYDTNPYGGFYVCNYTIPYYVGIANGSYYESRLWKSGDAVTGAVWNDYAEFRTSECKEFGYVVMETGKDTLIKTTERLSHFAGVTSDTWGFSQGETETAKTPLAVAGRVLVYTYKDRNEYKPGDCVCAAPNGTVDIMTRDEIIQFPDRIVGTVSCVPDYEEWGGGKNADRDPIKVNGRIWIKVR